VQTGKQEAEQCHFTIIVDSLKIPFSVTHFLETLEPTEFRTKIPELEKKIDNNFFCTTLRKTFTGRPLCSCLRKLFVTFEILKAKLESTKKDMSARIVSEDLPAKGADGRMSIGILGAQNSRGIRKNAQSRTAPPAPVRSNLASSIRKKTKETNVEESVHERLVLPQPLQTFLRLTIHTMNRTTDGPRTPTRIIGLLAWTCTSSQSREKNQSR